MSIRPTYRDVVRGLPYGARPAAIDADQSWKEEVQDTVKMYNLSEEVCVLPASMEDFKDEVQGIMQMYNLSKEPVAAEMCSVSTDKTRRPVSKKARPAAPPGKKTRASLVRRDEPAYNTADEAADNTGDEAACNSADEAVASDDGIATSKRQKVVETPRRVIPKRLADCSSESSSEDDELSDDAKRPRAASGRATKVTSRRVKAVVNIVLSKDWFMLGSTDEPTQADADWATGQVEEIFDKLSSDVIRLSVRFPKPNQGLQKLIRVKDLAKISHDQFTVLFLLGQSGPLPARVKNPVGAPRSFISFTGGSKSLEMKRFCEVARVVQASCTGDKKYDMIVLPFSASYQLAELLRGCVTPDTGIIVHFGDSTEGPQDGVSPFLAHDMVMDLITEIGRAVDDGGSLDPKDLFGDVFVELGAKYLAPDGYEDEKEDDGKTYKYSHYNLEDCPSKNAQTLGSNYVEGYHFAGFLQASKSDGTPIVDEDLLLRRENWQSEELQRVNDEYESDLSQQI